VGVAIDTDSPTALMGAMIDAAEGADEVDADDVDAGVDTEGNGGGNGVPTKLGDVAVWSMAKNIDGDWGGGTDKAAVVADGWSKNDEPEKELDRSPADEGVWR
jgi:hypothetical protein